MYLSERTGLPRSGCNMSETKEMEREDELKVLGSFVTSIPGFKVPPPPGGEGGQSRFIFAWAKSRWFGSGTSDMKPDIGHYTNDPRGPK